jgi:hypothetical protein
MSGAVGNKHLIVKRIAAQALLLPLFQLPTWLAKEGKACDFMSCCRWNHVKDWVLHQPQWLKTKEADRGIFNQAQKLWVSIKLCEKNRLDLAHWITAKEMVLIIGVKNQLHQEKMEGLDLNLVIKEVEVIFQFLFKDRERESLLSAQRSGKCIGSRSPCGRNSFPGVMIGIERRFMLMSE